MSTILDSVIEELEETKLDQQLKKICDQIYDEEKKSITHPELQPVGPNIFLAVQIKSNDGSVKFLTLERIMNNEYVICLWKGIDRPIKVKSVNVRNTENTKQIIKEFARHFKILKGGI